jgi:glycosyltransferase involved in cell wall biosynthesis
MNAGTPLRIGIMLRSLDEKGGIGVYTRYITEELLALDRTNHYVLFYRTAGNLGRFAHHPHVTERLVSAPGKILWDQWAIPRAAKRERVDVLFHPKFTVPFLAHCPTVMTVHGPDWFIPEFAKYYGRLDVAYIKTVMPWYFRKARAVCSVSQITTDEFNRVLRLPPGKVVTTYLAPGRHFRRIDDPAELARVRAKYALPPRFILTLSKVGTGSDRKNFGGVLEAWRRIHPHAHDVRLVVGGKDCHTFRERYAIPAEGYGAAIDFPGWIAQEDLPAVFSMAECYLYPSNLEAFPIPVSEGMACGVPVVTSRTNGLLEIAGDGAVLVDPDDPDDIARGVLALLQDPARRAAVSAAGLERSKRYSWDRCARETLAVIEGAALGSFLSAPRP